MAARRADGRGAGHEGDGGSSSVEVDGVPFAASASRSGNHYLLALPRGQHLVTIQTNLPDAAK